MLSIESMRIRACVYVLSHKDTGKLELLVRATNLIDMTRPETLICNGPGYHGNAMQKVSLLVT
jgi:hypothetical protein